MPNAETRIQNNLGPRHTRARHAHKAVSRHCGDKNAHIGRWQATTANSCEPMKEESAGRVGTAASLKHVQCTQHST
eukprot:2356852-Alexandrium_andersonii.AAC.1